ncbi:CapA family protein [Streptomyces caatingaensis]|uniref:Poly-gamma-glutamate biosynthesis protein n=1 Tax=Streptomyces caatingaensis TaxID=1678637 RepID=A0A0K9XAL7_9ACTN|nr:CapA family protein [Streptomyces caatingaensis]KNB50465.1 poly-gamma-glutamate biosynthesis protein [Streptomyces caatingaensis]
MTVTVALAGDTMLGRGVAERLAAAPEPATLLCPALRGRLAAADLVVLNLECCVSDRGEPWPAPGKPFFFRAPPEAARVLAELGVDCVTLANNHALDYGYDALADTLDLLAAAGIAVVGAGRDEERARAPAVLEAPGLRLAVVGATDHPEDFAATPSRPGVALADLRHGLPAWLRGTVEEAGRSADAVLVTPHWGPNMTARPPSYVRAAATALHAAGAALVAGHSAHVFHGAGHRTLYDMGDFVDDYAVDPVLRNDLGLLFLVAFDGPRPVRLEAVPLCLEHCHTVEAEDGARRRISDRFVRASAALGTTVTEGDDGRLTADWPADG